MNMPAAATLALPLRQSQSLADKLSTLIYTRRGLLLALLLLPPLLWFGVIYLGSLFSLLANSFGPGGARAGFTKLPRYF
jgi:putative spermidine/putrescine transport system permease protein